MESELRKQRDENVKASQQLKHAREEVKSTRSIADSLKKVAKTADEKAKKKLAEATERERLALLAAAKAREEARQASILLDPHPTTPAVADVDVVGESEVAGTSHHFGLSKENQEILDFMRTLKRSYDSSASSADESNAKKAKASSEFNSDGSLIKSAVYEGMSMKGMTYHSKVADHVKSKIINDQIFEICKILKKSDLEKKYRHADSSNFFEVISALTDKKEEKKLAKTPQALSKCDLLEGLFIFGMYYLQKYPAKANSFFRIPGFHKQTGKFSYQCGFRKA